MTEIKLCCFGDSFVQGIGDDHYQGWVGRFGKTLRSKDIDLTLFNLGIRRNTSADILHRWEAEAKLRLPEISSEPYTGILLFSFGINDCVIENNTRRVSLENTIKNTEMILIRASKWKQTVMIGPTPTCDPILDERVLELSHIQEEICAKLDVPFFAPYKALNALKQWHEEANAGDGTHPNNKGYQHLSDLISSWSIWRDILR